MSCIPKKQIILQKVLGQVPLICVLTIGCEITVFTMLKVLSVNKQ